MRVIETRCVDQCHRVIVVMIVDESLDLTGLRLVFMTNDDILVTSESADELKVVLS